MAGELRREEVDDLLARCHRRCCICHRFCGVKIETHHIDPSGGDEIDNAIPVCFECHAEIASHNPNHPCGRRFRASELRLHKEQWLRICEERPDALIGESRRADVGPLHALIDELDYNLTVASQEIGQTVPCPFRVQQFARAIEGGAVSVLDDELKGSILAAYVAMGKANSAVDSLISQALQHATQTSKHARPLFEKAQPAIEKARNRLLRFLGHEVSEEP